jgi:hypothetical protein
LRELLRVPFRFNIIKLVKAISDCPGRIVADKNDERKRPI